MIVRLSLVMNRTVVDSDSRFHLTTCAVEAPVTVNDNPLQDCTVLEEWSGFYGTDYKKRLLYSDSSGRLYSSYQKSHNMTHGFK